MSEQVNMPFEADNDEQTKRTRKVPVRINFEDMQAIDRMLKKHLHRVKGGDFWEYDDDWTDQKIADAVSEERNKPINFNNVNGFRAKYYGLLYVGTSKAVYKSAASKELEERIEKIELWMSQYDTLCKQMKFEIDQLRIKLHSHSIR